MCSLKPHPQPCCEHDKLFRQRSAGCQQPWDHVLQRRCAAREQLLALVTPASVLEVAEIEPEIIQQLGRLVASTASTHRDQRPAYIPFLISTPGCLWAHRCRSIFLRSCTAFTLGGLVIDPTQFPAGGAAGTAQRAAARGRLRIESKMSTPVFLSPLASRQWLDSSLRTARRSAVNEGRSNAGGGQ